MERNDSLSPLTLILSPPSPYLSPVGRGEKVRGIRVGWDEGVAR